MLHGGGADAQLVEDPGHVLLDRGLAHDERLGDAEVGLALRHRGEHIALARRQVVERAAAPSSQHPADDLGIERAAARRHPLDGVRERRDVADALLEQVADALGTVADQVERVGLLVELRQHEHADGRKPPPQLHRGYEPVVLASRRHLHVDHHDVGPVGERLAQQVVGVARLRDDVEAELAEQPHHALAQQHVVLPDRPHAAARTRRQPYPSGSVAADQAAQERAGKLVLGHEPDGAHAERRGVVGVVGVRRDQR